MPVDGETARVHTTGMHAAGGNSGVGTWTGDTTGDSNRRCGQTGDNCADIVHTRCPQRRASISDARRVRGGSLAAADTCANSRSKALWVAKTAARRARTPLSFACNVPAAVRAE